MKKLFIKLILVFCIFSSPAFAQIKIFACEPEWASLAKEITQEKSAIFIATTAQQSAHFIQAKPSLIAGIRSAEIVFCSGSDLEIGWLPVLLQKASNPQIMSGGVGYLMASDYVPKLEISRAAVDRSQGDIHPNGNPHIHLDPQNIPLIAAEFLARVQKIDPQNSSFYQKNYDDFTSKWKIKMALWKQKTRALKGFPIVVQHNHWIYLSNWLSLKQVAKLEEKPGIAPSSKYLAEVLSSLKATPAQLIIYAPFEDKKAIFWLNEKAGIKAVALPFTIGGAPEVKDLFDLFDVTIDILKNNQS